MKKAYCVELDRVISTYEAWGILFGAQTVRKSKLTFKCPDPKCRTDIIASNLRKISLPSEVLFKTHLKARHEPYCNFASKGTSFEEIISPEQAKELLSIALGYLYRNFADRLEKLEKKININMEE